MQLNLPSAAQIRFEQPVKPSPRMVTITPAGAAHRERRAGHNLRLGSCLCQQ